MSATDTASSLDRLLRAISLTEGTAYFLVLCDHPEDEAVAVGILSEALGERARVITLDARSNDLLRVIRNLDPPVRNRDVLLVTRMEAVVSRDSAQESRFLTNLNAARDTVKRYASVPIVFFVPQFVLAAISRRAPDFFSTNSGVFQFEQEAAYRRSLFKVEYEDAVSGLSLTGAERTERIRELREVLRSEHSGPRSQVRTAARLVGSLIESRSLEEALAVATEYLALAHRIGYDEAALLLQVRIGHVLVLSHRLQEAERMLRAVADDARNGRYPDIAGAALNHLGVLYGRVGRDREAEEAFRSAIALSDSTSPAAMTNLANLKGVVSPEERVGLLRRAYDAAAGSGDRVGVGIAAFSLAWTAFEDGAVEEALSLATEALAVFEACDRRVPAARTLGLIGMVEAVRHEFETSEDAYRRALDHLGDTPAHAAERVSIVGSMAILAANRGDLIEAAERARLALHAIEIARRGSDQADLFETERRELLTLLKSWSEKVQEPSPT